MAIVCHGHRPLAQLTCFNAPVNMLQKDTKKDTVTSKRAQKRCQRARLASHREKSTVETSLYSYFRHAHTRCTVCVSARARLTRQEKKTEGMRRERRSRGERGKVEAKQRGSREGSTKSALKKGGVYIDGMHPGRARVESSHHTRSRA